MAAAVVADHLGEAGNVVDGLRRDGGRGFVVGKAAQRILEDNLAASQHAEGAAGKGARGDGFVEDAIGGGKAGWQGGGSDLGIHRSLASYCVGGWLRSLTNLTNRFTI